MNPAELSGRLIARAASAGLALPDNWMGPLLAYLQILSAWNRRMNLTAFDLSIPSDLAIDRLLIEPLLAARYVDQGGTVIDIGSGGGSPAIPFAIASSASRLTMVESKARKSVFLREAARAAGVQDATVITGRYEEIIGSNEFRGRHDILTVRAVRTNETDLKLLQQFLKPGGRILWFKSRTQDEGRHELETVKVYPLTSTSEVAIIPYR